MDYPPAINPAYLTGSLDCWHLAELSAMGYRGLEVTPACIRTEPSWEREAEEAGMEVVCVNAIPELTPYLTGSLSDAVEWRRRDTLERLGRVVDWMDRRGIRYMVVAPSRLAENYQSVNEAGALLVSSLRELASFGNANILVESAPFRLFASSKDIVRIVSEVDMSNVGAALDVGHALIQGENPSESAAVLGGILKYVQVHDADLRPGFPKLDAHLPLGKGSAKAEDLRPVIGRTPWAINIAAPTDPVRAAGSALQWLRWHD